MRFPWARHIVTIATLPPVTIWHWRAPRPSSRYSPARWDLWSAACLRKALRKLPDAQLFSLFGGHSWGIRPADAPEPIVQFEEEWS